MRKLILAGIALCLLTPIAQAQKAFEKGDIILRAGVTVVDPESKGLTVDLGAGDQTVSADSATSMTFNVEYLFAESWGVELLAAVPFKHDLELDGEKIGSTKQLPPTLTVKWHPSIGRIAPYIGVGANWTIFYDEKLDNSTASLSLDDSFGIAGQIGFDWVFANNWLLNADIRYIQIETDAAVDGTGIGTVDVNPFVYGLNVGYKF